MKKLLVIICCVAFVFLSGCNYNESTVDSSDQDGRMSLVYNDGFAIIYIDNITGVQYFSRANSGSCVMVDSDGKPLVIEEKANENVK